MSAESDVLMQQFRQAVYERLTNPGIVHGPSPEGAIEQRSILFRNWQSGLQADGEEEHLGPDLARHWAVADVTAFRDVRADRQAIAEDDIFKNISASPAYSQILASIDAKLFEQVKAAAAANEIKIAEKLGRDVRELEEVRREGVLVDDSPEGQGREQQNAGFVGGVAPVYQESAQGLAAARALDLDVAQVLRYADTSNVDDLSLAMVEARIHQVRGLGFATLKDVTGSDPGLFYDTALARLAPAFDLTASAPATAYFANLDHKALALDFASKAREVVTLSSPEQERFHIRVNLTYIGHDEYNDEETRYHEVDLENRWPDVDSAKEYIDDRERLEAIIDGKSLESIEVFDASDRVVAQKMRYGEWLEPIFEPSANEEALARISALRSEASVEAGWDNYTTAEGLRNRAHAIELQLNLGAVHVARAFEAAGRKRPPGYTVEQRSALFSGWKTELGAGGQTENHVPEQAPADRQDSATGDVSAGVSGATHDKPSDERLAVEGAVELVKAAEISLYAEYADDSEAYRIEKAQARRMEDEAYKKLAAVQVDEARGAVAAEREKIASDSQWKSIVRFDAEKHRAAAQALRQDAGAADRRSSDLPEGPRAVPDQVGLERERESGFTVGPESGQDKPAQEEQDAGAALAVADIQRANSVIATAYIIASAPNGDVTREEAADFVAGDLAEIRVIKYEQARQLALNAMIMSSHAQPHYKAEFERLAPELVAPALEAHAAMQAEQAAWDLTSRSVSKAGEQDAQNTIERGIAPERGNEPAKDSQQSAPSPDPAVPAVTQPAPASTLGRRMLRAMGVWLQSKAEEKPAPRSSELPESRPLPDRMGPERELDNGFTAGSEPGRDEPVLEPADPAKAISKVLENATYETRLDGSVLYLIDKRPAFVDHGKQILMEPKAKDDEEAILAAVLLAKEKYGGAFEVTGSDRFKRRAIEIMLKHQLDVTLKNPEQEALRRELAKSGPTATEPSAPASTAVDRVPVKPLIGKPATDPHEAVPTGAAQLSSEQASEGGAQQPHASGLIPVRALDWWSVQHAAIHIWAKNDAECQADLEQLGPAPGDSLVYWFDQSGEQRDAPTGAVASVEGSAGAGDKLEAAGFRPVAAAELRMRGATGNSEVSAGSVLNVNLKEFDMAAVLESNDQDPKLILRGVKKLDNGEFDTTVLLFKGKGDYLQGYVKVGDQKHQVIAHINERKPDQGTGEVKPNFLKLSEPHAVGDDTKWKEIGFGNAVNRRKDDKAVFFDEVLFSVGNEVVKARVTKHVDTEMHRQLGFEEPRKMRPKEDSPATPAGDVSPKPKAPAAKEKGDAAGAKETAHRAVAPEAASPKSGALAAAANEDAAGASKAPRSRARVPG